MSIDGVRSSQGDSFQTLIATRYAVEMIHNGQLVSIEVDSTSLDSTGNPIVIDDIVVRYSDGVLYVQTKKNQTHFKAWSLGDLEAELRKVWIQWRREPSANILFVSRNDFGEVAKLRGHATTQPTGDALEESLTAELSDVARRLCGLADHGASSAELLDFLRHLDFETVNQDRFRSETVGQLKLHVAHGQGAYQKIATRIDAISRRETQLDGRQIDPHSLSRKDLLQLLQEGGFEVCLPRAERHSLDNLTRLSAIGRDWIRQIAGVHLERAVVHEIVDRILTKPACLLITAGPGIGKTCALLSILERLEQGGDAHPVFLQSREFAVARSASDIEALGLPATFLADAARLSESRHVVVLIDSLDTLSLAREHFALGHILSLVDRLRLIPNTTVVVACRSFDIKYERRLADRTWGDVFDIPPLDWEKEASPLIAGFGADPGQIPSDMRDLVCNPRLLAVFHGILKCGVVPLARSGQELTEQFLHCAVRDSPSLGEAGLIALMDSAQWMLDNRRLDIPAASISMPQHISHALLSAGVMISTANRGLIFAHQTLLDVLAVWNARRAQLTLASFIRARFASPFVRPTIRAFLFSLRSDSLVAFRNQVRQVVDAADIAFHIRRLVVESIAEMPPTADDWPLVRHIFKEHQALFLEFHRRANSPEWHSALRIDWLNHLVANQVGPWLIRYIDWEASSNDPPPDLCSLLKQALAWTWVDPRQLRWSSIRALDHAPSWPTQLVRELFEIFIVNKNNEHESLGAPLSKWVLATNSADDLLWQFICRKIEPASFVGIESNLPLDCSRHKFVSEGFLAERMTMSEPLLDLALDDIERWSDQFAERFQSDRRLSSSFLMDCSFGRAHSARETHPVSDVTELLAAFEEACRVHASQKSNWWTRNGPRMRTSRHLILRYVALIVVRENVDVLIEDALALLQDEETLNHYRLRSEVGLLIKAAFPHLTSEQRDLIQQSAKVFDGDEFTDEFAEVDWRAVGLRDLLWHVPTCYRSEKSLALIARVDALRGPHPPAPELYFRGGWVRPPVAWAVLVSLSDRSLVQLFRHHSRQNESASFRYTEDDEIVGGKDDLQREVREAASRSPLRFLQFLELERLSVDLEYLEAVLSGVATHLKFRFGNLKRAEQWTANEEPDGPLLADRLLWMVERTMDFWRGRYELSNVVEACVPILDSDEDCHRLSVLILMCLSAHDPLPERRDSLDLIGTAINSTRGVAAAAAFRLAGRRLESRRPIPLILSETLKRAASDEHPAVCAIVLHSLPVIVHYSPQFGWTLFNRALLSSKGQCWQHTFRCLYYSYHSRFELVAPYLLLLRESDDTEAIKVWARIGALSCLAKHIELDAYIDDVFASGTPEAVSCATTVFVANLANQAHRAMCTKGLIRILGFGKHKCADLGDMTRIFLNCKGVAIDLSLLNLLFVVLSDLPDRQGHEMLGFGEWLASIASLEPDHALEVLELAFRRSLVLESWNGAPYAVALTSLFREGEERELSDGGQFLSRLVACQDELLKQGMVKLSDWLRDAERP